MSNMEFFREVPATVVIEDPVDVEAFLAARISVSSTVLHTAVEHGAADASLVTDHGAAASYGWRMYDGTLTSLRDQLAPKGWLPLRPGGLEVATRKDKLVQITPSMGTEETGLRSGHPTCKHERGASTAVAVEDNQTSLADLAPDDPGWTRMQTWWLLYHLVVRGEDKFVRSELSLPLQVKNGRITEWGYRILLGERPIGTTNVNIPAPAPEPTIPALRRRAEG
ncbi:MAG: hypothetical protein AB7Q27_17800 [Acidimicrobiia bacterium]